MKKHTPGPWEVYDGGMGKVCVGSNSGHVATCELVRDAPVVAAAPELLASVKSLSIQFHAYLSPNEISRLCQLITKAEGRAE